MAYKRKVEGQEVRKIQDVPVGEFVQVKRGDGFTSKVYKNEGWDRYEREYFLADQDDISRGRWLKKNTLVLVGFTY